LFVDVPAETSATLSRIAFVVEPAPVLGWRQAEHALERAPKTAGVFIPQRGGDLLDGLARELESFAASCDAQSLLIFAGCHAGGGGEPAQEGARAETGAVRQTADAAGHRRIRLEPVLQRQDDLVAMLQPRREIAVVTLFAAARVHEHEVRGAAHDRGAEETLD
jgi:hypothetical protein